MALLCLFGSSSQKKNAWKHADALAACLVVVVAHACGWSVFRLAGERSRRRKRTVRASV